MHFVRTKIYLQRNITSLDTENQAIAVKDSVNVTLKFAFSCFCPVHLKNDCQRAVGVGKRRYKSSTSGSGPQANYYIPLLDVLEGRQ